MVRITSHQWSDLIFAVLLYTAALVYLGYQYGQGDQTQILPCLYEQDHSGTYPSDHYVHQYLNSKVNERTVFHAVFRYMGYNQPWVVLLWHALIGISLILSWLKIAGLGLRNKAYQCLAVGLILIVGFHTSTGSNELYYNSVIPSLAAKALGSWALYYWLKEEFTPWIILLIISSLLQPLVGIQLFILTAISLGINLLIKKRIRSYPWKMTIVYIVLMVPWYYLLAKNNGGHADPNAFMKIMEFRLAHHFFPSTFGTIHLLLAGIFAWITIRFYRERLVWFSVLIVGGCIVYTIGVEKFNQPLFLYTQWWKTTIWLEALAFIAIVAHLEKLVPSPKWVTRNWMIAPLLILLLVGVYRLSGWFGDKPEYMFPWASSVSDEVDISIKAGQLTPSDATFIVPVEFSAFRWYAKRCTYVDYKAMLHQEIFLKEWYQRIQNIYAFSMEEQRAGFDIHSFSHTLLEEPSAISLEYWDQLGINYIISTSPSLKTLKLLGGNDSYYIYGLK